MLGERGLDEVAADMCVGSCTGATDSTLDGFVVQDWVLIDSVLGDCVLLGFELDERRLDEDVLDICTPGGFTVSKDVLITSVLDFCVLEEV